MVHFPKPAIYLPGQLPRFFLLWGSSQADAASCLWAEREVEMLHFPAGLK